MKGLENIDGRNYTTVKLTLALLTFLAVSMYALSWKCRTTTVGI